MARGEGGMDLAERMREGYWKMASISPTPHLCTRCSATSTRPSATRLSLDRHDGWATSTNEMYPPQLKGGLRRFIRKDKAKTYA